MRERFRRGDTIRVLERGGGILCVGTALHTRTVFGLAEFQVQVGQGEDSWVYSYSLNNVDVERV